MGQEFSTTGFRERGVRGWLRGLCQRLRRLLGVRMDEERRKEQTAARGEEGCGFEEFCAIELSDCEERLRPGRVRWGRAVPERPQVPSAAENMRVLRSAEELWHGNCPHDYPLKLPDWRPILRRPLVEQQVAVRLYVQRVSDMLYSQAGSGRLSPGLSDSSGDTCRNVELV